MNYRKLLARAADNWFAKAISIAAAIFLFVFNRMNNLEERFFSTPLRIEAGGGLTPASTYPRMIRLSLRGEANSLYPIREEDIEAYLDLTVYTLEGAYRAPVRIRKKGTALGVDPLETSVDPPEVFIELERKISKYIPLAPNFQGYVEQGYELVSYTMTPSQVVVDGPVRLMEGLSALQTDAIELDGRGEDFSLTLHILNPDPLLLIRGDGVTEFRGFVKGLIILRNFEDLPVLIQNLREDLVAQSDISQGGVRLEGSQKELESYDGAGLALNLDCAAIQEPGTYRLPVQAEPPPGFTLVRSEPAEVTIQVSYREEEE